MEFLILFFVYRFWLGKRKLIKERPNKKSQRIFVDIHHDVNDDDDYDYDNN